MHTQSITGEDVVDTGWCRKCGYPCDVVATEEETWGYGYSESGASTSSRGPDVSECCGADWTHEDISVEYDHPEDA